MTNPERHQHPEQDKSSSFFPYIEPYPFLTSSEPTLDSFLDRLIRSSPSVLVLSGPPGSGKTTLSHRVMEYFLIQKPDARIFRVGYDDVEAWNIQDNHHMHTLPPPEAQTHLIRKALTFYESEPSRKGSNPLIDIKHAMRQLNTLPNQHRLLSPKYTHMFTPPFMKNQYTQLLAAKEKPDCIILDMPGGTEATVSYEGEGENRTTQKGIRFYKKKEILKPGRQQANIFHLDNAPGPMSLVNAMGRDAALLSQDPSLKGKVKKIKQNILSNPKRYEDVFGKPPSMEQGAPLRTILRLADNPLVFDDKIMTPEIKNLVWDCIHHIQNVSIHPALKRFTEEATYLGNNFQKDNIDFVATAARLFATGILMRKNNILADEPVFSAINWGTSKNPEQDYELKKEYLREIGYIV